MLKTSGLQFGPLPSLATVHLCVDMQMLFLEGEWRSVWMQQVRPAVGRLVEHRRAHTVFTRFIPALTADAAGGSWRRYYHRWSSLTLDKLNPARLELLPELAIHVPPAAVFDKRVYSPWLCGQLHRKLRSAKISTLVISGGETDVCVLATVLGAIDLGYRVVLAQDALCSSSDDAHDASLALYHERFSQQIECSTVDEIIDSWI